MKSIFSLFLMCIALSASAQMDNQLLEELLTEKTDSIQGFAGRWQVSMDEMVMVILTDETNDRMRIIAPIIESSKLDEELLLDCMTANFHSALDVKYAISDGVLWSAYVHPLSPLTEMQLDSALKQVYAAAVTFGTTFSSTSLLFGGNQAEEPAPAKKDSIIFRKT